jgi:HK97 gp10 family phage protein
MIELKIEGLDELRRALLQLPKELRKGPLRSAVSAGARIVQRKAAELAPIDEGTLKKAIYRTRSREGSSSVQEMAIVGVRYGKRFRRRGLDAWYWRFIEFGTRKMRARPFMRPAFEQTKPEQLEAIRKRLGAAIERAAAKLRVRIRGRG